MLKLLLESSLTRRPGMFPRSGFRSLQITEGTDMTLMHWLEMNLLPIGHERS